MYKCRGGFKGVGEGVAMAEGVDGQREVGGMGCVLRVTDPDLTRLKSHPEEGDFLARQRTPNRKGKGSVAPPDQ